MAEISIKRILEENEHKTLFEYAQFSDMSKGRKFPDNNCDLRTEFQIDRDRIIHSKSFRRLKDKTQVYVAPVGDHYRTRLTHTLEVTQVGRTIARCLRLNEDLVEAMCLAHDLGHTPFGHSGEDILDKISPLGFKHYEQSLRVVDYLERHNENRGLNLTYEVRDGIINHTGDKKPETLEGYILKFADRIAYLNHDIDDAIRGGYLDPARIPKDILDDLGHTHGKRIDTLIRDIVTTSYGNNCVEQSDKIKKSMLRLREFMFENIYWDERSKRESENIEKIISILYSHYLENPQEMGVLDQYDKDENIHRIVTDYIAGMTDYFAVEKFKEICIPKSLLR